MLKGIPLERAMSAAASEMLLRPALLLLLKEILILGGYETAPANGGLDKTIPLQVFIRLLDGDHTDMDGLCQSAHGRYRVSCLKLTAHNHGLD